MQVFQEIVKTPRDKSGTLSQSLSLPLFKLPDEALVKLQSLDSILHFNEALEPKAIFH